ncbi:hypothetical protein [Oceanicoccus sp. KOV_DT_Chl]|uniref:hypothetical protein n=1 Tax=Oceanicoccus sp. KOV_DT_Chl TaxID=1904639 RepID=UPI0011AFA2A7|nr:hypothetical protein [Oceanicoccus sp. KOV_DT_Chl]
MKTHKITSIILTVSCLILPCAGIAGENATLSREALKSPSTSKLNQKEPANKPQRANLNGQLTAKDLKYKKPENTSQKEPAGPGCIKC